MDELFLERMNLHKNTLANKLDRDANILMDKLFSNDSNYKLGALYDSDQNLLEKLDFKFQYVYAYSAMNKDKVEFYAQFRPYYHPEKKYVKDDGLERLGFYLDIPNDMGDHEKWLILGRNETKGFTRYNILKCNWTFSWITNGHLYSSLGCLRNRNNYTSGIWSDGFSTTVQNEAQFIIPTSQTTKLIDYDMRFMISDNEIHPKVYKVTKVEDTFPVGAIKVTLTQDHYNESTDNVELKVCDFFTNAIKPIVAEPPVYNVEIKYNGTGTVLHKSGSARVLMAVITDKEGNAIEDNADIIGEWKFYINGTEQTEAELVDFNVKHYDDNKKIAVSAKQSATVGTIIRVTYGSIESGYYDDIELEVKP